MQNSAFAKLKHFVNNINHISNNSLSFYPFVFLPGTSTTTITSVDWQNTGNSVCSALTRIETDLAQRIDTKTCTDHQDTELEVGLNGYTLFTVRWKHDLCREC